MVPQLTTFPCPSKFIVDLTMQDERPDTGNTVTPTDDGDEESGPTAARSRASTFASDTELQNRKSSRTSSLRQKLGMSSPSSPAPRAVLSAHLHHLVGAHEQSGIARDVKAFHIDAKANPSESGADLDKIASFKQASWWTQFRILSGRAFKNLYRNPMLMLAHYVVSIVVARGLFRMFVQSVSHSDHVLFAVLCSFLFAHVT